MVQVKHFRKGELQGTVVQNCETVEEAINYLRTLHTDLEQKSENGYTDMSDHYRIEYNLDSGVGRMTFIRSVQD